MVDVAADDDDRADLRHRPPVAREERGQQAEAGVPQQRGHHAPRPDAEHAKLLVVLLLQVLDDLARHRRDDRGDQHRLGDHHRARGVEQAERAERSGAGEQQVDEEADHDGGQPHQCVQDHDDRAASAEAAHGDRGPQRQAGDRGDQHRPEADLQGERHDLHEVGIERDEQPERFAEGGAKVLHGVTSPASGDWGNIANRS